jgi:hypothetical protein
LIGYKERKKRLNAQDDDQIFTNAINSKGNYNNKYVSDQILPFVRSLNLSKPYKGKLDFHSFRNNASLQLQDIFVPQSYINNIMGWKGQTIMEQHYSKHSLSKIKVQADKLRMISCNLNLITGKKSYQKFNGCAG